MPPEWRSTLKNQPITFICPNKEIFKTNIFSWVSSPHFMYFTFVVSVVQARVSALTNFFCLINKYKVTNNRHHHQKTTILYEWTEKETVFFSRTTAVDDEGKTVGKEESCNFHQCVNWIESTHHFMLRWSHISKNLCHRTP